MENWGLKKDTLLGKFARRLMKQTLVAFIIFITVIGLLGFDGSFSKGVYRQMSYYLSASESDWGPSIKSMVASGLWMDSIDKGAYEVMTSTDQNDQLLALPLSGTIIKEFGWTEATSGTQPLFYSGIAIETDINASIRAALAGQVVSVGVDETLGRLVVIQHMQGLSTVYANCEEILVATDDLVSRGQIIAKAAKGLSGKGYLYFEVRKDNEPVDPLMYLNLCKDSA
jgi:murein DD-endopeptidase MepM/ murein hydrolase activator NlpD